MNISELDSILVKAPISETHAESWRGRWYSAGNDENRAKLLKKAKIQLLGHEKAGKFHKAVFKKPSKNAERPKCFT